MTSSETGSPPVRATPPPFDERLAQQVEADFRVLYDVVTDEGRFTTDVQAAALLGCSPAGLVEFVADGRLDAVYLHGKPYVLSAQLQQLTRRIAADEVKRSIGLRAQVRLALTAWLDAVDVTGDWSVSRTQYRPLVTARRGARHLTWGIDYHNVVFKAGWLSRWALDHRDGHPDLALPVGRVLSDALAELPGVASVSHVTPLAMPGSKSHRVDGWVRIDPRQWPVRVPADVQALLEQPR